MNETQRFETLTQKIHNYFDVRDPLIVPRCKPEVEEHVMEMFQVVKIEGTTATLLHLFSERTYVATVGDAEIARLIRPKDVFLMAIIRRGRSWRVWHMSPPYF